MPIIFNSYIILNELYIPRSLLEIVWRVFTYFICIKICKLEATIKETLCLLEVSTLNILVPSHGKPTLSKRD